MESTTEPAVKLQKSLKLIDVYAMATGAMFSSGLFLLPGIAASYTGESVYLAYLFAGFLILPAMLCMGELSTAMPKAGGTYFFLDRSMGPIVGTVGGLGSWIAVVFKSAFALVGMGAYLSIYLDLPVTMTAIILTVVFAVINWVGAKETTWLQRILVFLLVVILTAFVFLGLVHLANEESVIKRTDTLNFFSSGLIGFVSTIGLVFVSYAGLTKVASVAEEVENPDRNIPLGMALSLLTATAIYTLGAYIIVKVLEPKVLFSSLTPVADAGRVFLDSVPYDLGILSIVVAAIAAFASTANAGIMSASRYPYAMSKDKLLPESLSVLGRFNTPANAILITSLTMVGVLMIFDVASVAKLASAFQLLLFGLVCLAVIVMREAQIDTYKPGFRIPLYPWLPITGILISFWLIVEMGIISIGFTGMVVIGCVLWYQFYSKEDLGRRGAIFHIHERLGRQRYEGLEDELMSIIQDRTENENLAYELVISRSTMYELSEGAYYLNDLIERMAQTWSEKHGLSAEEIEAVWGEAQPVFQRLGQGLAIAYRTTQKVQDPALFIFRFKPSAKNNVEGQLNHHTLMFLLVPPQPVGLDLRLVGHLAETAQSREFLGRWLAAKDGLELNEILFRADHVIRACISSLPKFNKQIGKRLDQLVLPQTCTIALIQREGRVIVASPSETLNQADILAIIGNPIDLQELYQPEPE